jgi:hypothetical protein
MLRIVFCLVVFAMLFTMGIIESQAKPNSQEAVAKDRLGQYALIKKMIDPRRTGVYPSGREPENLGTCGDMELELGLLDAEYPDERPGSVATTRAHNARRARSGLNDATTYALVRIAGHYYKWDHELPKLGYPRQLVLPLIDEVEQKLLSQVVSKGGEDFQETISREANLLAKRLNAAARERHLRAPKVFFGDECGGGGILTEFKVPEGAHLFYTSDFLVRLCREQGYDPSDRSSCNRWEEVFDGSHLMLAGYYYYIAVWRDGDKEPTRFKAEALNGVFRLRR